MPISTKHVLTWYKQHDDVLRTHEQGKQAKGCHQENKKKNIKKFKKQLDPK